MKIVSRLAMVKAHRAKLLQDSASDAGVQSQSNGPSLTSDIHPYSLSLLDTSLSALDLDDPSTKFSTSGCVADDNDSNNYDARFREEEEESELAQY